MAMTLAANGVRGGTESGGVSPPSAVSPNLWLHFVSTVLKQTILRLAQHCPFWFRLEPSRNRLWSCPICCRPLSGVRCSRGRAGFGRLLVRSYWFFPGFPLLLPSCCTLFLWMHLAADLDVRCLAIFLRESCIQFTEM